MSEGELFLDGRIRLFNGDSREVLKSIPDCSVDSCASDPPYALVSIGKRFGKPGSAPAKHGKEGLYARASAGFMGQAQWLCRLVTPPGGVVLDQFAGTGSTGEAAWREGFSAILIEREATYADDIRRRMALCLAGRAERRRESLKARGATADEAGLPLFGGTGGGDRERAAGSTATSPTRTNDRPDRTQAVSEAAE